MQHLQFTPHSSSFRRLSLFLENTRMTIRYALLFVLVTMSAVLSGQNSAWPTAGQNRHNTRNAMNEDLISPETVISEEEGKGLQIKWVFEAEGDLPATPAVSGEHVYFPDWSGNLYKVNRETGLVAWKKKISDYTGVEGDFARATPAIAGRSLIIGTQADDEIPGTMNGAHVLSIDRFSGQLLWMTKVDDFIGAIITQSAVVWGNRIYVGVSSNEESLATDDEYPCCSFRGSLVSLDLRTGKILWKTYMIPDLPGFSGNAVWGSTPVIDTKRKLVYITTGNNYTVPQEILDCVAAGGTSEQVRNCVLAVEGSDENYFDAIVALDLFTGEVKWVNTVLPFDAWTVACLFEGENCPDEAGPDYDFGQGPALFFAGVGDERRELLGAGQKSGIYWAFDPDENGKTVWSTQVGPGGTLGGLQWGSAVDGERIYVAISNNRYIPHTMTTGPGRGRTVRGGFWAALDALTGEVLWENAGINPPRNAPDTIENPIATNQGAVSVANGVVFAGSMDTVGTMYAFDAETGEVLWTFESGGSVLSGAAIVDGSVYWGSGYGRVGGSPNNQFYAFAVNPEPEPLVEELALPDTGPQELHEMVQTHPNPFNASTELSFTLPQTESVRVIIYDATGNEIEILHDGLLEKGNHQIQWNPVSTIPEGVYTVQMITSAGSVSKQVIKI